LTDQPLGCIHSIRRNAVTREIDRVGFPFAIMSCLRPGRRRRRRRIPETADREAKVVRTGQEGNQSGHPIRTFFGGSGCRMALKMHRMKRHDISSTDRAELSHLLTHASDTVGSNRIAAKRSTPKPKVWSGEKGPAVRWNIEYLVQ
jgi:hypothetical protein